MRIPSWEEIVPADVVARGKAFMRLQAAHESSVRRMVRANAAINASFRRVDASRERCQAGIAIGGTVYFRVQQSLKDS